MEGRKGKIGEGNTKKREFLEKVQVSYPKRGGKNANASFLSATLNICIIYGVNICIIYGISM